MFMEDACSVLSPACMPFFQVISLTALKDTVYIFSLILPGACDRFNFILSAPPITSGFGYIATLFISSFGPSDTPVLVGVGAGTVAVNVCVITGVRVRVGVGVTVRVRVRVSVTLGVAVRVNVELGTRDSVLETDGVAVFVGVKVSVGTRVSVNV